MKYKWKTTKIHENIFRKFIIKMCWQRSLWGTRIIDTGKKYRTWTNINLLRAGVSAISGVFMSAGSQHGRIGSYTNTKTALKGLTKNSKEYNKALKHLKKVTRRLNYKDH